MQDAVILETPSQILPLARGWKCRLGEYGELVRLVRQKTGKGFSDQCRDILALRLAGGQCGISDYYAYRLYDREFQLGRGAVDYIGWRLQQQFSLALNPRSCTLPGWDKLVFTLLANESGLPTTPIVACYHPCNRLPCLFGRHLKSLDEAREFLRDQANFPLFGKPAFSQQGIGSAYLAGYDTASDGLLQLDGRSVPVETFLKRLQTTVDHRYHKPECGYLFQKPMLPAKEIRAITDWNAICGVRLICLNGNDGVTPISAGWKIAVPPNQIDNFGNGRYGNLSGCINPETGIVGRIIDGFWPKASLIEFHPITGHRLIGFHLPGWKRLLEICRQAGRIFPLMKIHHWDFALTDNGPVLLELNDLGGIDIDQAFGHGLLTAETRAFLKKHGDAQAYPWISRL